MDQDDWRARNRAMWDGKVAPHLASPEYDIDGFRRGRSTLQPFETADLGNVHGRTLLHLQCHIGLDTLSWARHGAEVTGLDFSPAAVAAARRLAQDCRLDARFVCSDVYDAPAALGGERFDIVYTGVGALCWLPDIARWARTVAALLKPGGTLYLFEFHPVAWVFERVDVRSLHVAEPYFTPQSGYISEAGVTYASRDNAAPSTEWNHPLGAVVTALVQTGLSIALLRELDGMVIAQWPGMVQGGDGLFRLPADMPNLPLMYVLRATAQS